MYENITITTAKLLKGPKIMVEYLMPDKVPGSFGPSTNEPNAALIAAFKALDPHCCAMLGRLKDSETLVHGKKGEIKNISFKLPKTGEEEKWIGHDWHVHSFNLTHSKSGDGIILGYTETLFNDKVLNATTPLYRLGEENGYLYLDGLLECIKTCEDELIKYMQAPPVQQELPFTAPPLNGGNVVMEFDGKGEGRVMVDPDSGAETPF